MKKYMKIVESVTDDFALNAEIESKLATIDDPDERMVILDYLQQVFDNKQIAAPLLRDRVRALHPDFPRLGDAMNKVQRLFPNLVDESMHAEDELVVWTGHDTPAPEEEMGADALHAAASQQIEIVYRVVDEMTKLPSFRLDDVRECLYDMGLPEQVANMFADHVMTHFTNKATRNPDGSLSLRPERQKTISDHISQWKADAESK